MWDGSTLAAVLVGRSVVLAVQLGDGEVLWVDDLGVRRPLGTDPIAFADATPSLCGPLAWQWLRAMAWPRPHGDVLLALLTDGYVNSYPDDAALNEVASGYLDLVRENGMDVVGTALPDLLGQVTRQGSGDDVTLGLVYLPATGETDRPTPEEDDNAELETPDRARDLER